jgi:hypothetical protein
MISASHSLSLDTALLTPLAFFSVIGRRISLDELLLFSYKRSCTLSEIQSWLKEHNIPIRKGFIYCDHLDSNIKNLLNPDSLLHQEKITIAKSVAGQISKIPFVRMVAIINSIPLSTATQKSDIDLFILTEKKRLWIVRSLVPTWLRLKKMLKTKDCRADKACLGMYASTELTSFEHLQLAPENDIYFTYWTALVMPILDNGSYYRKWLLQQKWLFEVLPNIKSNNTYNNSPRILTRIVRGFLEFIINPFGNIFEKFCFRINLRKIYKYPENYQNEDSTSVIITGSMLKLHPYDKRPEIQKKFEKTLATFKKAIESS